MDVVTPAQRSAMMRRIRGRDTRPEKTVRQVLHRLGYRYRLHRRDLPGTPDISFPRHHKVLFVNGCFWHRHAGCKLAYKPKSNNDFWRRKFLGNVARDEIATAELRKLGWEVLTVWECEVRVAEGLTRLLERRLADAIS